MSKIVALVPMRHHSQRVPGKNYRLFAGKPLFHYIIETLLACPEINQVVVDTDSQPVMEGLRADFPTVILLARPETLRADDISMNEIIAYDTSQVQADYYLQTHATNPLLRSQTVSAAIQKFLVVKPSYDFYFPLPACNGDCGINLDARSTIIRQSCCKPRTCLRFSKRTHVCIFLPEIP